MRLRAKVFLIVSSTLLVLLAVSFWIIYVNLNREFTAAQHDDARAQIATSFGILNRDIESFTMKLRDWAQWDDSYTFMQDQNQAYIDSNLNDETFQPLGIDFLLFLDTEGNIVFEKQVPALDKKNQSAELPSKYLREEERFWKQNSSFSGLFSLDGNTFLLATRPIVKSNGSGTPRGTLYFGRQLHQDYFDAVSAISHVQFLVQPMEFARLGGLEQNDLFTLLSQEQDGVVSVDNQQKVSVARYFPDIFGEPTLIAVLQYDGHIIIRGLKASLLFGKTGVISSICFVAVVFLLTEWLVLKKLLRLEKEVRRVTDSKDVAARVNVEGSDEFASLGEDINKMLGSLQSLMDRTLQSESRFDVIANLAPVMIWMTNEKGEYIYLNKSAKEFISHVAGKNSWGECVYLEDLGMRKTLIEEARSAQRAFRLEYRVQKQAGGYVWVSESAVPHITSAGKLIGYLGVVVDIHQEKEIQIQSKAFTRDIEEMNDVFMAREEKMLELKEELKRLRNTPSEQL